MLAIFFEKLLEQPKFLLEGISKILNLLAVEHAIFLVQRDGRSASFVQVVGIALT